MRYKMANHIDTLKIHHGTLWNSFKKHCSVCG